MKVRLLILLLVSTLLAGLLSPAVAGQVSAAAPQSHAAQVHTDSHTASFDKTRFVAHLAVSAYLIHYIYKKYKEHKLGRTHIFTDIKAAAAALIAYHEIHVAYNIAKTSKSKTLQALISPIRGLDSTLSAMKDKLKRGDTSQVSTANSEESGLHSVASGKGFGFSDQKPSSFGGF